MNTRFCNDIWFEEGAMSVRVRRVFDLVDFGFLYCAGCILLKQEVLARYWTKCSRHVICAPRGLCF